MMENGLNLPMPDRPKYSVPISDKRHSETFTKAQQEAQEFVETNHALHIKYLSGKWLDEIIKVYMDNFFPVLCENLELDPESKSAEGEWKTVKFHEMMRKVIFDTSTITFFGTRLSELWGPTMWEDWRVFNDATYAGVRSNFSYYLQPKALMARKRMLEVFDQWVECEVEEWPEDEGAWREKWGIRMNWEREKLARRFGFTRRGRSCSQAGFLFV
jgi:oxysterol 7-alpha-hydroxylase